MFWQQSQRYTGLRTRHSLFILSCLSCFVVLITKRVYLIESFIFVADRTQIYLYSKS